MKELGSTEKHEIQGAEKMEVSETKETQENETFKPLPSAYDMDAFRKPQEKSEDIPVRQEGLPDLPDMRDLPDPLEQKKLSDSSDSPKIDETTKGLSEEEKTKINKETGWSYEIIDAIGSTEEYEIYKKAGLQ